MCVHRTFILLISLAGIIFPINTENIPEVECKPAPMSNDACFIRTTLTSTDGRMKITGNKDLTAVYCVGSVITTISSDICDTFHKLRHLELDQIKAKIVAKGAFANCRGLTYLLLANNSLKQQLDESTFSTNLKLNFIDVRSNALGNWPAKIFANLRNLKQLWLTNNRIEDFPISLVMNSRSTLNTLYVDENLLRNLDAEGLVKNFPKLDRVHLRKNVIPVHRQMEIKKIFESKNIETDI